MSGDGARRDARRKYKETPRPMGVFAVRDTASGLVFIGASVDLPAMLNRQRFQLEAGGHPDRALQAAWDSSGGASFSFEVLDTLEPSDEPGWKPGDDLRMLADLWREKLGC